MERVISIVLRALYSGGDEPATDLMGWVCPTAGVNALWKRKSSLEDNFARSPCYRVKFAFHTVASV